MPRSYVIIQNTLIVTAVESKKPFPLYNTCLHENIIRKEWTLSSECLMQDVQMLSLHSYQLCFFSGTAVLECRNCEVFCCWLLFGVVSESDCVASLVIHSPPHNLWSGWKAACGAVVTSQISVSMGLVQGSLLQIFPVLPSPSECNFFFLSQKYAKQNRFFLSLCKNFKKWSNT